MEALAPLAEARAPWYFRSFAPGNCLDPAWDRPERRRPWPARSGGWAKTPSPAELNLTHKYE
ncbi:MAG: hypothetical protein LBQ35_02375 [Spirochaetaceae bacterium]|nr:hypothetical protein [Spirochaetaceae bacterium]